MGVYVDIVHRYFYTLPYHPYLYHPYHWYEPESIINNGMDYGSDIGGMGGMIYANST